MGWAFLACAPSKPHFVLSDILALLLIHQYSATKLYRPASSHTSLALTLKHVSSGFMRIYVLVFGKSLLFFPFKWQSLSTVISLLGKWRLSVGTPLMILSVGCFHYVLFTFLPCSCPGSSL